MVVGRADLLLAPRTVDARGVVVRASGKRCAAGRGTPLAALAGARRSGGPSFTVRDYGGSCSRRAADGGALFVTRIGGDRNRGRDGWTYKVGSRSGSAGAADPSGPFGSGLLRAGAHVTWFWCRLSRSGSCQRTLAVRSAGRVSRGGRLRVVVRGYDDFGHGRRIGGARVSFGSRSATTNRRGVATVRAPGSGGRVRLTATKRGLVRAFDRQVRVG
ncbi:MAG: hypothetical protein ACJ762_20195 [Solirubrobacteraceae bacterium]